MAHRGSELSAEAPAGVPAASDEGGSDDASEGGDVADRAAAASAGDPPDLFGDVDCDGDLDSVDGLKILQSVAAIPFSQNEPCIDIGEPL